MYETRQIAGYTVNLVLSKDGQLIRRAAVLVGPDDKPGWRAKDGPEAKQRRREAKRAVMAALGLDAKLVDVRARYSCLSEQPDGTIARRDDQGRIIGVYET